MEVMRNNEERMKKQVKELTTENKKYSADLKALQETVTELNRQLANYEKDKQYLIVGIWNTSLAYNGAMKNSIIDYYRIQNGDCP